MAPAEQPEPGRALASVQEPGPVATGPVPLAGEPEPVAREELNSWRRGFTPQAELWNGRLAMLGLSIGLTVLLVGRLLG